MEEIDNNELQTRIEQLEEKIKKLEDHQHLGLDGSKEFSEETVFDGKEINMHGAGSLREDFIKAPISIYGGLKDEKNKRGSGLGFYATGDPDSLGEQTGGVLVSGVRTSLEDVKPSNRTEWDKKSLAEMTLIHSPFMIPHQAGPTAFPSTSFLVGKRDPTVVGRGTITTGGNTLTDNSAKFRPANVNNITEETTNTMLLSILWVEGEVHKIISNTEKEITINGTWALASGTYDYQVITPILLGSAQMPYTRVYAGDDIRLGYGSSGGDQVQYILWGNGSPENVMVANRGSLYLRRDGGSGTTLYIKESNDGQATGWIPK